MRALEHLVDEIYESAVNPSLWMDVMEHLAQVAGAEGTTLLATSPNITGLAPGRAQWIATPGVYEAVSAWLNNERWIKLNIRGERLMKIREPRWLVDHDGLTQEEIDTHPYYTEFVRPQGFGWVVGTTIRSSCDDILVFSIERRHDKGPVERERVAQLDRLRPSLARAALFSAHLGLERARASVDTFDLIGIPAAAINSAGRAIAVNRHFENCGSAVRIGAFDTLTFADAAAQALFAQTLATTSPMSAAPPVSRSFAVRNADAETSLVMHLIPLRRSGLDVFTHATWLLYGTPVTHGDTFGEAVLQSLFDLTTAEARVARLVARGLASQAICEQLQIKPSTFRYHLKSIFAKTGTGRQSELTGLLLPKLGAGFSET